MAAMGKPGTAAEWAKEFKGAKADRVEELLTAMEVLGQARKLPEGRFAA